MNTNGMLCCHYSRPLPFFFQPRNLLRSLLTFVLSANWHLAQAEQGSVPGIEAEAVVRVIIALVVIIMLIIGLAWGVRRYSGVGSAVSGQMRVLGSLPVGNRERVVLVKVGEEQILLGVAPGRVQALHVLDKPINAELTAGGRTQGGPFAARLRSMMQNQPNQQ